MMRLDLHFYSFERYQEEAVLFDRIMPFTPFCAIFGWFHAATQYQLALLADLPIPWQQHYQLGLNTMNLPPQRLTKFHGKELCRSSFLAYLSNGFRSAALPIAALTAAALPTGRWLTWCRGQERPLQCFVEISPIFDSTGGNTETMVCASLEWFANYCTNACRRLVNLSYLLTSLAPSGGYPASCYSVVASSSHG